MLYITYMRTHAVMVLEKLVRVVQPTQANLFLINYMNYISADIQFLGEEDVPVSPMCMLKYTS